MYADDLKAWRSRLINQPLHVALLISMLLHAAVFSGWEMAQAMGWTRHSLTEEVKKTINNPTVKVVLTPDLEKEPVPPEKPPTQLTFVDVDPATAAKEAPKDAKYYSAISSKTANTAPKLETDRPNIDGKQSKVIRTFDASQTVVKPTQIEPSPVEKETPKVVEKPVPPTPPRQVAKAQPKQEPHPSVKPGKTTASLAQPSPSPNPHSKGDAETLRPEQTPAPPKERPRTIAAAKAQLGMIAGEKSRQDGGVRNIGRVALNVKGTPFGTYDAQLVAAIQKRWYDLLDQLQTGRDRKGEVVVEFKLHYDGTVTGISEVETTVGDFLSLICQRAVVDPAPFPKWPTELRLLHQKDYREVRFTFYYN